MSSPDTHYAPTPSSFDRLKRISLLRYVSFFICSLLSALRPSFLGSTTRSLKADGSKTSKTAYLDGLKGFAALMIYAQHNTDYAHQSSRDIINHAWLWQGHHPFTMAPVIKIFFHSGNLAVMLFFAISGYVTSVSLLKLQHSHETAKLARRLGVAIPQRFVRLWGPACGVSFTFMMSWYMIYRKANTSKANLWHSNTRHIFDIVPDGPHHDPAQSLSVEIPRWIGNFFNKSYIYSPTAMLPNDLYDPHLWYIPLQFQASIVIYIVMLCMLSFDSYPASVRLASVAVATVYFGCFVNSYFCALSTFGMLLCDIDLLSDKNMLPTILSRYSPPRWFWYIPLGLSLFISTCPSEQSAQAIREGGPGWYYLSFLKPPAASVGAHWFNALAAILLLPPIPRIAWLKSFFELPFLRDIGKISFSFYLIQGPILWTVGDRIYAAFGRTRVRAGETVPGWINIFPLPDSGPLDLEINFICANLILLPLMLWLAGIATKVYEAPSNSLALWVFNPDRFESSEQENRPLQALPR